MDNLITNKINNYLAIEEDSKFKNEVEALLTQGVTGEAELYDRFYRDLEFGTAGLRGIVAGGFNRMNKVVVGRTTVGLGQWLLNNEKSPSVVISYDCRHYSLQFAQLAASLLATMGIKVYCFTTMHPTPALAYAVCHYKASAGIMITASHNPPEYNGYKVFQSDGSQIISPADKEILAEIERAKPLKTDGFDQLVASKKITLIGNELDEAYFAMALQMVYPVHLVNKERLKIVYTPLHGTGAAYIEHLFRQLGFNFNTVAAQREGDGNFPTVSYPNPEEPAGLKLALDEAKATKAHLVLATDPDSDRLAVAYANKEGNFEVLNGHQMGALFAHYLIQRAKARGINLDKAYIVKSLVTSDFEAKIAQDAGVTCYNVLTGFKWIAHEIRQQEALGKHFILGNEEAIGYLVQTAIRDKDGITAALVASEMALYYLNQNKTLGNVLDELYAKFGYYNDSQISKSYTGEAGAKIIVALMKKLREKPPVKLGERLVDKIYDYEHCTIKNSAGSLLGNLDYAKSNIMQFYFSDGSRLSVRPSGTEPKIKFYISAVGKTKGDLSLHKAVEQLIDELTR